MPIDLENINLEDGSLEKAFLDAATREYVRAVGLRDIALDLVGYHGTDDAAFIATTILEMCKESPRLASRV